jgi:hypothetical protein
MQPNPKRKGNTVNVEARKRDLIIRIADWTRDKDEPAYDVEIYCKGSYIGGECFTTRSSGRTKAEAKAAAVAYAQKEIADLMQTHCAHHLLNYRN